MDIERIVQDDVMMCVSEEQEVPGAGQGKKGLKWKKENWIMEMV